ncbi:hypothetical protein [Streptomyces sp. JJ38]|uniref:hypothetical protein n=1 Tax=Streptomyces sp. JJ38 TaxID=2738128 RepID=UPI001C5712DB|nr:hypothetical protein [Streptomyces sp. JJ38]MBW1599223.1 hypothetical protein [Streptomyces sp. JJ38]
MAARLFEEPVSGSSRGAPANSIPWEPLLTLLGLFVPVVAAFHQPEPTGPATP